MPPEMLLLMLLSTLFYTFGSTEDCALVKADNAYAWGTMTSSYVRLPGDFTALNSYFEVEYDVLPSAHSSSGPVFSIASWDSFNYTNLENRTAEYIATTFSYGSVQLLVKTNTSRFLHELTVSRTWPDPFDIFDGSWHHIRVYENPFELTWMIQIDYKTPAVWALIPGLNNVSMVDRPAYIGGKPEYTDFQFQGMIKNVQVNGKAMDLRRGKINGLVEIADCQSYPARIFRRELAIYANQIPGGRPY